MDSTGSDRQDAVATIALISAKGGQGCSTTAAALAIQQARAGRRVELCSADAEMPLVLGLPFAAGDRGPVEVIEGLTLGSASEAHGAGVDLRVLDCGADTPPADAAVVCLVSSGCYLALAAATRDPRVNAHLGGGAAGRTADGLVHVEQPGRAVTGRDAADVLGLPLVATVPHDRHVARCVDAGVLARRLPQQLVAPLGDLAATVGLAPGRPGPQPLERSGATGRGVPAREGR